MRRPTISGRAFTSRASLEARTPRSAGGCPRAYECDAKTGCECIGPACGTGFASYSECITAHAGCEDIAVACGARAGDTCSDDEYCAYAPGQECGAADAEAVCVPRPEGCDGNYEPVCGCDHETYGNACEAAGAGIGVLAFGECE